MLMEEQTNSLTNEETILTILKAKLGIVSNTRDEYLKLLVKGIIEELSKQQGIELDLGRVDQQIFIADYAEFRYNNREYQGFPRHLQWRLHNLYVRGDEPSTGIIS